MPPDDAQAVPPMERRCSLLAGVENLLHLPHGPHYTYPSHVVVPHFLKRRTGSPKSSKSLSRSAGGGEPQHDDPPLFNLSDEMDFILHSPEKLEAFSAHLRDERSSEHLEFLLQVQLFKSEIACKSVASKRAKALFVYTHFVNPLCDARKFFSKHMHPHNNS